MSAPIEKKITDSDSGENGTEDRKADRGKGFRLTPSTCFGIPLSMLGGLIIAVAVAVWAAASNYSSVQAATKQQSARMDQFEKQMELIGHQMSIMATKEDVRNLREDIKMMVSNRSSKE